MNQEPDDINAPAPADQELGGHLADARPVPSVGFRRALQDHLAALDPGYGSRPARLGLIVAGYLVFGLLLIGLGALLAL